MVLFKYLVEEFQALVYEVLCIPTEILTNTLTKFCRYSATRILKRQFSNSGAQLIVNETLGSNTTFHKLCIVKLLRNTE
jgi:hypothetical protein